MPRPIQCILLVDDDPDDNFYHELVITQSGLCDEIRVKNSGPDALLYLEQTAQADYLRPDVIFLDINMPGMNGFEFLEHYHQLRDELKSRTVFVMLTTSLDSVHTNQINQWSEVSGYQPKPLTAIILQEISSQYFS